MADRRIQDDLARVERPDPALIDRSPANRSQGAFDLSFAVSAGRTRIHAANHSGCLRIRAPRVAAGDRLCAVSINTAGGLTGGDTLRQHARWAPGAEATYTSQAAEKIYRAESGAARIDNLIEIADGGCAEWLPQETILFNRAQLRRCSTVYLGAKARFLGMEALVFGRAAMAERVLQGRVRDSWRIFRAGTLIYADAFDLGGAPDEALQRSAIGAGARAIAVLICVAEGAAAMLNDLRDALAKPHGRAAASAWNGMLVARLLAPDSESLREDILAACSVLRGGLAPPRAWSC